MNEECLFAAKMCAAFFRTWRGRVKGRDWCDIVWFIRRGTPFDLAFFSKLQGQKDVLSRDVFLKMAKERIALLNVSSAIEDVVRFVRDQEAIKKTWSKNFFQYWFDRIQTTPGEKE